MQISSYKIGIKFQIDPKEMRALDRQMKMLEARFKKFGAGLNKLINFKIGKFDVNQQELNRTMRRAFELTSARTAFNLDNFRVDQNALNRSVAAALRRATAAANGNVRVNATGTPGDRLTGRHAVAAGGVGGIAARMYGPAIALGFGGYGLAQTNRLNQEVISAQLTTQAVTEAAGLQGQGPAAFDWLRQQGNRIGFSYMDQAQDYNNFLSNSLGAGMSLQGSQDIYLGFAEYARAMGITPARNKLVMNALSQMMGKGTVSMEELRRQMAESMPGTMDVFAQAYAEMTGSGLKGQEALSSLYDAIPTGKVKSAEILPIVQRILRERAAPKLDVAMKTSQAEQGRFQNAFADQAIKASQAGIEEGFSRIFRTLTRGLEESTWLTKTLANAFNEVTKPLSEILLFPQSFIRALDGRDSLVADWLGLEATQQLREDWSQLKVIFDQIAGMQTPEWMPTLEATTKEIAAMVNAIAEFSIWRQRTSDAAEQVIADEYYAGGGSWQAQLKGVIKANWLTMKSVFGMSSDPAASYYATRQANNGVDISPYMGETGFDPSLYWESQKEVAREQAKMTFGQNGYNLDQNNLNGQKSFDFKIDMNVDIKAANPEDFQEQFKNSFTQVVKETLLQYPETE